MNKLKRKMLRRYKAKRVKGIHRFDRRIIKFQSEKYKFIDVDGFNNLPIIKRYIIDDKKCENEKCIINLRYNTVEFRKPAMTKSRIKAYNIYEENGFREIQIVDLFTGEKIGKTMAEEI